jgi:hypothetical protein
MGSGRGEMTREDSVLVFEDSVCARRSRPERRGPGLRVRLGSRIRSGAGGSGIQKGKGRKQMSAGEKLDWSRFGDRGAAWGSLGRSNFPPCREEFFPLF